MEWMDLDLNSSTKSKVQECIYEVTECPSLELLVEQGRWVDNKMHRRSMHLEPGSVVICFTLCGSSKPTQNCFNWSSGSNIDYWLGRVKQNTNP